MWHLNKKNFKTEAPTGSERLEAKHQPLMPSFGGGHSKLREGTMANSQVIRSKVGPSLGGLRCRGG